MIFVANWKMNGNATLVEQYMQNLPQTIVCPPTTLLHLFKGMSLGAQDCSSYFQGAHTGEISATMLREAGCSHVIVGHSERRQYETHSAIEEKAKRVSECGMIPIVCCSEIEAFEGLDPLRYWVAYEPTWAIGTGKTPTPTEVDDMVLSIKEKTKVKTVLYGGSVNAQNAGSFNGVCDGFLIGGASLNVDEMMWIVSLFLKEPQGNRMNEFD